MISFRTGVEKPTSSGLSKILNALATLMNARISFASSFGVHLRGSVDEPD